MFFFFYLPLSPIQIENRRQPSPANLQCLFKREYVLCVCACVCARE